MRTGGQHYSRANSGIEFKTRSKCLFQHLQVSNTTQAESMARMPRKELLRSRSSFLRTARNFLKELPRNKDGEDLPRGTSLRRGGKGWRARKFLKERRGRMARIFLDARKFLASRKFLEIMMAIEKLP